MKKSPLFSTSNLMTAVFMILYGIGTWLNVNSGKLVIAGLWAILFVLNGAMLAYRLLKKAKNNDR